MKSIYFKIIPILFLINFCLFTSAQESQPGKQLYNFPDKLNYTKVKITTLQWDELKSPNLELLPNQNGIKYFDIRTKNQINLGLDKIHMIEYQTGSKALLWGLIGAGTGIAVFSALLKSDMNSQTLTPVFFACTGVGISIGVLIGSGNKKYKKIYSNGQFVFPK
jgi:hypothetical protein